MRHGAQGARRSKGGQRSRGGSGGGGGGGNNRNRVYESNGPEGRVRGTAAQVAEKYDGLAKDATSAGDHVLAQSFWQYAEHYRRVLGALDGDGPQQAQSGDDPDQQDDDSGQDPGQDEGQADAPGQQQQRKPRRPRRADDGAGRDAHTASDEAPTLPLEEA